MLAMKQEVLRWALDSFAEGLFAGTSGNLSLYNRETGVMAITPTSLPYKGMQAKDIVAMRLDGAILDAGQFPSSEWRLHAAIYAARPDVCGIVHTHSPYATSFAVAQRDIPIILIEMPVYIGGAIPLASFAIPGTSAVGDNAVAAMGSDGGACLMANHGVVAVGTGLEQAHLRAVYVEDAAKIATFAAINGGITVIPDEQIQIMKRCSAGQ